MKKITKFALGFAALGAVAIPVFAQDASTNQNAQPAQAQNEEQAAPGADDESGSWWGWGHKRGGKGGCEHGGRHHGRWSEGEGPGGPGGPGKERMMAMIDGNSDGVISDDEAASRVEGVFLAMDADVSGDVTKEEFMALRMGPGEHRNKDREAQMQKMKEERFAAMDPDKDGKVTKAEFLAAGKQRFMAADADKDGKVTPWEFRSMRP